MADISKERRELMRQSMADAGDDPAVVILRRDLLALLDAADERDRLRLLLFRTMRACEMGRLAGDMWLKEFGFPELAGAWDAPL